MAFNTNGFGSSFGISKTPVAKPINVIDQMDAYSQLLQPSQKKKYDEFKEDEDKPSWFQRVISVLTAGETGQAAYDLVDGKNPVASYGKSIADGLTGQGYDNKTYADVFEKLGMKKGALSTAMPWLYNETGEGVKFKQGGFLDPTARGALGLTLDILADPTTYLGGAGLYKRAGAKLTGLTEVGVKAVKEISLKYEKELAKHAIGSNASIKINEKMAEEIATKLKLKPDEYFKGLTFMGKEVIPREKVLLPGRYADNLMNHVPIMNKVYAGAKEGVQDTFLYGADVLREGKKLGDAGLEKAERWVGLKKKFSREADYSVEKLYKALDDVNKDFNNAVSKADRQTAKNYITEKIETNFSQFGIKGVNQKTVDNLIDVLQKHQKNIYKDTAAGREGLMKDMYDEISGYLPHIRTPEAIKAIKKKDVAKFAGGIPAEYSTGKDSGRVMQIFKSADGRVIEGTASANKLQPYKKAAEERFMERGAEKLIKTRSKDIEKFKRYVNQIEKDKLQAWFKSGKEIPAQKLASLKTTPAGQKRLVKAGKSPEGHQLWQESFSKKTKYKLNPITTRKGSKLARTGVKQNYSGGEDMKLMEVLFNAPKKELERFDKIINKIEGKKISKLGAEINKIKSDLKKNIEDLPDANTFFKDVEGTIFEVDRSMSIGEVNKMTWAKELMEKAGFKGKNFFETDPFAITLHRGQKAVREIETNNLLRGAVKEFGVESDSYKLYKRNPNTRKSNIDTIHAEKTIDDIRYVDPKIKELPEGTLLPEFIVADLKKTKSMLKDDEVINKVLKGYDKMINTWKGLVYGWFPASHGRNYIGGSFMNFVSNPKWVKHTNKVMKVLKGTDDVIDLGEKSIYKGMTNQKVKEEIGKRGLFSQSGALDMNDMNKSFNNSFWKKTQGMPMKAGTLVEANLRIPLLLAELADGKTMDDAMSTVYRYHFDYAPRAATQTERTVLKRLIPFYTWQRNAIPLMAEQMIETPGKMSSFYKAIRNTDDGSGDIDRTLLPSFLEKDPAIMREGQALSGLGMPPNEALKFFDNPTDSIIGSLTPALKIPVEIKTNFNTFKDKQITEDTNGQFAENMPQVIKDWLEWEDNSFTKKDGEEVSYSRVNPMRKYWLYALPTGRLSSLYAQTTGEQQEAKLAKFLTGVSVVKTDLDQMKATKEREYEEELKSILINAGVYSEYGSAYKSSKDKLKNLQ